MGISVNVRGKNIQITDSLRDAAEKAITKSRHFLSDMAAVNVLLSSVGQVCSAEITVKDRNALARVEESGNDMYNVLHEAWEILERKLKKYKNQMVAKNEGRPTSHATAERIGDTLSGADTEHPDAEEQIEIRKVKRFGIKPMFPEDAVLEMELLGHDFFVFANAEEDCEVNVVYRRKKGGYGLIRPEFE